MKVLTAPLWELAEFEEGKALLDRGKGHVAFSGLYDSQKLHMVYGLSDGFTQKIIVTFSDKRAREIGAEYGFYDRRTMVYPGKDLIFYQADVSGGDLVRERMRVLRALLEKRPVTIVTTMSALMMPQTPLSGIVSRILHFDKKSTVDERKLSAQLVEMGYEKSPQVEEPGQFSIRGGIIDIFDMTEENPYRIELWGDSVESIRSFDVLSQRSVENLDEIAIYPATELMLSEARRQDGFARIKKETKQYAKKLREQGNPEAAHRIETQIKEIEESAQEFGSVVNLESFVHYFYPQTESFLEFFHPETTAVFLDEPQHLSETANALETEFRESMTGRLEKGYILPGQAQLLYPEKEIAGKLSQYRAVSLAALDAKSSLFKPDRRFEITVRSMPSYNNSFEALLKDLKRYKKNGSRVLLLCASRTRAKRLAADLREQELSAFYSEDPDREVLPGETELFYGHVEKGFEYPMLKFTVISEGDIFGAPKKKKRKIQRYEGTKIRDFGELKVGDYVVHETHGLGIYQGIEKVEMEGTVRDYMKISYRDGGNLYVLATGLDAIQKYASADAAKKPKLNKLGTQEWHKTKTRVRAAVDEVAKDLVELYAARQNGKGYAFSEDTVWQREFEEMFPFEETDDQLMAIAATKRDMESNKIMDRLICGDVGYGKTEVAIRAAFKAVQDGKQVAFLVPTTILALQHYRSFSERLRNFPVRVEYLNRTKTTKEVNQIRADLEAGRIDILIGTHKILGRQIKFRDLGLLIIDEEQKFGVAAKEKLTQMAVNVDTLTLTATPIPRTLQFSLMGSRDLSVISTPPPNRQPIVTESHVFSEEIIRDAVEAELARGGQVYFVHNRVEDLMSIQGLITRVCPKARVAVGHGKMPAEKLEKLIMDFIYGEFDVLVSTTIIENGIDIPNANTIIVDNAQNFGLSDLHQLRGRVGRSNQKAYCYLLSPPEEMLSSDARRRLRAIEEFSDLGSGFNIAMQDLDIRGAGNLLGAEQSGFIADIGFETYQKIMNEAIAELRAEGLQVAGLGAAEQDVVEQMHYVDDAHIEIEVEAGLPDAYVAQQAERLKLYRELDSTKDEAALQAFESRLADRFGPLPREAQELLNVVRLRWEAIRLGIERVKVKNGLMILHFVGEQNSPYYKSDTFMELLRKVTQNPARFVLKQHNNRLAMTVRNVKDIEDGYKTLQQL